MENENVISGRDFKESSAWKENKYVKLFKDINHTIENGYRLLSGHSTRRNLMVNGEINFGGGFSIIPLSHAIKASKNLGFDYIKFVKDIPDHAQVLVRIEEVIVSDLVMDINVPHQNVKKFVEFFSSPMGDIETLQYMIGIDWSIVLSIPNPSFLLRLASISALPFTVDFFCENRELQHLALASNSLCITNSSFPDVLLHASLKQNCNDISFSQLEERHPDLTMKLSDVIRIVKILDSAHKKTIDFKSAYLGDHITEFESILLIENDPNYIKYIPEKVQTNLVKMLAVFSDYKLLSEISNITVEIAMVALIRCLKGPCLENEIIGIFQTCPREISDFLVKAIPDSRITEKLRDFLYENSYLSRKLDLVNTGTCLICLGEKNIFTLNCCMDKQMCHSCYMELLKIDTFECPFCRQSTKFNHFILSFVLNICSLCDSHCDPIFKNCTNSACPNREKITPKNNYEKQKFSRSYALKRKLIPINVKRFIKRNCLDIGTAGTYLNVPPNIFTTTFFLKNDGTFRFPTEHSPYHGYSSLWYPANVDVSDLKKIETQI